ncbi:MAG: glycosyltransferase [Desulfotomaculaceae bacterium]
MKRLLYVTVTAPLGRAEAFIIPEMNCLIRRGIELTVVPLRPARQVFHQDGAALLPFTLVTGLWSIRVWLAALFWLARAPWRVLGLLVMLLRRGSLKNRLRNLLVFPKGLLIADQVRLRRVEHIHAHWASTPSTCAMVASVLTGVDWSFTAHRWDIQNNNLLAEKAAGCSLARAISGHGYRQLLKAAGPGQLKKVVLVPMGVEVPEKATILAGPGGRTALIAAVGSLTPVKGHRHLIRACGLLARDGVDFRCLIIGEGSERRVLSGMVDDMRLWDRLIFTGAIPNHRVLKILGSEAVNLLVHPSVETPDGEREGVPVAVMEAMARGVPVIVTRSGGLSDLVNEKTGLLVSPGDPEALARAVIEVLDNPESTRDRALAARCLVEERYNLEKNVSLLLNKLASGCPGGSCG